MVNILLIPTTSWVKHQNPNRLNFIFDHLAKNHTVYVMDFNIGRFKNNISRSTKCITVPDNGIPLHDPGLYYIINAIPHYFWMWRKVKELKIDLIVTSNIIPSSLANFMGVPVVMDYLDHFEESAEVYYPNSIIMAKMAKYVTRIFTNYNLDHADQIITITSQFKDEIRPPLSLSTGTGTGTIKQITNKNFDDIFDKRRSKIAIIPNGVDTTVMFPMDKTNAKEFSGVSGNVIGYVGSLEHWVDLELVITSLHAIDATLMIVGAGIHTDYAQELLKFVEKEGLSDKVIFKGFVPYDQLRFYINAMDIGLNPLKDMKHNDLTVGGKVLNYIACDVPVVSSNASAIKSLIGNTITDKMIFTYNPNCRFEFIDIINQLLSGAIVKDSTVQFINASIKYDWKQLSEQYDKVLMKCVGSRASYPPVVGRMR